MQNPIVRVKTLDNVDLQGLHFRAQGEAGDRVIIHLHGIWGNCYENPFIDHFISAYPQQGFAYMTVNTRFHDGGSLRGKFETCLLDIRAWLDYAQRLGYRSVILQGHSLGTHQAVYYMTSGQPHDNVRALILLAPVDNIALYCTDDVTVRRQRIAQAKAIAAEDPDTEIPKSLFDTWPLSAGTYLNLIDFETKEDVFPFREGTLVGSPLSTIRVPAFVAVAGNDFTLYPSAQSQVDQLRQLEGIEAVQITNAPHNFAEHEPELLADIQQWLARIKFD
jgi:pimeloyl-ACP methyl ester carboxylesterase